MSIKIVFLIALRDIKCVVCLYFSKTFDQLLEGMGNCGWKVALLSGWHLAPLRAQPLEPKQLGLKPSFLPCNCVTSGRLTLLCLSVPFCQIYILASSLVSPGPSKCSLMIDGWIRWVHLVMGVLWLWPCRMLFMALRKHIIWSGL